MLGCPAAPVDSAGYAQGGAAAFAAPEAAPLESAAFSTAHSMRHSKYGADSMSAPLFVCTGWPCPMHGSPINLSTSAGCAQSGAAAFTAPEAAPPALAFSSTAHGMADDHHSRPMIASLTDDVPFSASGSSRACHAASIHFLPGPHPGRRSAFLRALRAAQRAVRMLVRAALLLCFIRLPGPRTRRRNGWSGDRWICACGC